MQTISSVFFVVLVLLSFTANSFENQSQSSVSSNEIILPTAANNLPDSLQRPDFTNTLLYPILDSMIVAYDQYYTDAISGKADAAMLLRERLEQQSNKIFKLFNEISDTDFDNFIVYIDKYGQYTESKINQYYNTLIEAAQLEMQDSSEIHPKKESSQ